jgi:hypothetical protein
MQALGSYQGGRMLFLSLGTGLRSALIVDNVLEPMELALYPTVGCPLAPTASSTVMQSSLIAISI